jgi:nucleotide-binding universal stress UspA family protein
MQTIVLGYDDTPASQRALERAAQLAKAFGSKLIVTSVAPVMLGSPRSGGPTDPVDSPEKHQQELARARQHLEGLGIRVRLQGAIGEPADTLVEIAKENNADLIVVGTREPNVMMRMLGQSTSGGVVHKAHCDVMVVHASPPWASSP